MLFTSFNGAKYDSTRHDAPFRASPCSVLEIADLKVMLDCGWDSRFHKDSLAFLEDEQKDLFKDIDVVLVTHGDLEHVGALPYAYKYLGLDCRVIMTAPVKKTAQLALYDAVLNGFAPYTLANVDAFIDKCQTITFKQVTKIGDSRLILECLNSGRTVGGCYYHMTVENDTSDAVYMSDINSKNERHLLKVAVSKKLAENKPTLLICDALPPLHNNSAVRKAREAQLEMHVFECLHNHADVLIPGDSVGVSGLFGAGFLYWVYSSFSLSISTNVIFTFSPLNSTISLPLSIYISNIN